MNHYVKKKNLIIYCLLAFFFGSFAIAKEVKDYDICIYGGTSAGIIAAYTASKAGKSVVLVEPGGRLGGMSSGGLGYTDIGNKYVVQGLALDFYRKLGAHYGKFEQWIFEPKVAEAIFKEYIHNTDASVLYHYQLAAVQKKGNAIEEITLAPTKGQGDQNIRVKAKVFLDCSYEGDLMARAGVSYHVGREDNSVYGETLNGVQFMTGHQMLEGIDPYTIPGDVNSGLVWGVTDEVLLPDGTGDKKVQAYNYRITLTNVPANRLPIEKPANYDPRTYELLKRTMQKRPLKNLNDVFIWSLMPNGKTDINNRNGFSTDMIGMNWDYPEADYARRKEIIQAHEEYTKGLLYFVGHDSSVPEVVREEMQQWGYPKDEYVENGHWSPQLYIRESRRMQGALVMTQHHCQGEEVVDDAIGYAAYTMDSHNCDRLVVNGMVKNEGNVEVGGFPPFPISYRAIIPKKEQAANLLVPVCLSASHIAYGSIRMEPVFMVLAQSAAVAACLAIDEASAVQDLDVQSIKKLMAENPKADGREGDIFIDSQDDQAVKLAGNWDMETVGGYGRHYLKAAKGDKGAVRFMAKDLKADAYTVYSYYPKLAGGSSHLHFRMFNGADWVEKKVAVADIQIEGQTAGDWLNLGTLKPQAGKEAFVEILNDGADGAVAANAVLLVPMDDQ